MNTNFHKTFKFLNWQLDETSFKLILNYEVEIVGKVSETLTFPAFELTYLSIESKAAINKACDLIHYLCGVSYYKAGMAQSIRFDGESPSRLISQFIQKTWKNGLAEMAFENDFTLNDHIHIPYTEQIQSESHHLDLRNRSLVPIGGGKDSMVTIEELKNLENEFDLFMVGNSELIKTVAEHTAFHLVQVVRQIDSKLIDYNKKGAFNGHVPITSINSAIAVLTALLLDYDSIVFSNERSADSANTTNIDGDLVNHQYSKSLEFENNLREVVFNEITPDLNYFSLQRPYSELAILKKFAQMPQYFQAFSSCNRNFHLTGSKIKNSLWCGDCPKCRFVYLGLAPFLEKSQLLQIFGLDLLNESSQQQGFAELLGLTGFKPFECVGEIKESQIAFNLIKNKPEWRGSNLVLTFKDQVPQHSDIDFNNVMSASKMHNIPTEFLL